ncbi:MAG: Eco57I restriction-modification methylase domain-containing protein [bacterium]
MAKEPLQGIIQNFSPEGFIEFFRTKNRLFKPFTENLPQYNDDIFTDGFFIGEIPFDNVSKLGIYAFRVTKDLTERSGKKAQYEKGKRILKETNSDAGIFVFYDSNGNFRFSLIYPEFSGTHRQWSYFKRFTYFVSPALTNKTFLKQIGDGDFSSIASIKQAFSVEKVTKEFYTAIANWYFWAVKHSRFPEDAERLDNGRNIAIIRLITRIIFIWFMKVRGLVPDALFNKEKIKEILLNISENESTYYKAILQNLFFATLNTKQEERAFRSEIRGYKGYNPDYGNHNVYRYQKLFKHPEAMEQYFARIPFLNGGLFECLDYKSRTKQDRAYIDGFTDLEKYQPDVPNFLFFSEEKEVDLNRELGTKNKSYKVRGLIDILSSYNFTINENEPDDAEVALDPELLGIVFENLLASYNPETATTARKATGSYYTPRPIVDYMVTQSLIQYFKTHLLDEVTDIDAKLSQLFSQDHLENPFDGATTQKMIALIEQLRVVDPAVGSGAFPMSILNKLVLLLFKLDPNNSLWKQRQIDAIKQNIKDPVVQNKLIDQVEKQFRDKNADYGRKLYLIEKCIYGVDIQQIAVEIAKLRFFISLLVDEKIDPDKPNYGIEPLPNLDFKLMQGNSLISSFAGIDFDNLTTKETKARQATIGFENRYNRLISQFEEVKNQFQNEPNREVKDRLRERIDDLLIQIFEEKLREHFPQLKAIYEKAESLTNEKQRAEYIASEKQNLSKKLGFDLEQVEKELIAYTEGKKTKDFFLWDIYFAEVFHPSGNSPLEKGGAGGFDIVIANPPYIQLQKDGGKLANLYKDGNYQTFERTGDIYALFYEKGIQLLKPNGYLCYITSNKWMRAAYGQSLRVFFSKHNPILLIDLGPGVFENATVDTNILLLQKAPNQSKLQGVSITTEVKNANLTQFIEQHKIDIPAPAKEAWFIGSSAEQRLKEKIESIGKPLKEWDVNIYYGIKTGLNEAFIITTEKRNEILANCKTEAERQRTEAIIKPILRGRDIKRYHYDWAGLWVIVIPAGWTNKLRGSKNAGTFFKEQFNAVYQYLKPFEEKAKKRDDQGDYWWELRHCAYYPEVEKEKVVWQRITQEPTFCLVEPNVFILDSMAFFTGDKLKYIMALVNSKLIYEYVKMIVHQYGFTGFRLSNQYVEVMPLPPINSENESIAKQIESTVDQILSLKKQGKDTIELEKEIDRMVYQLYNLTPEEIEIVEGER